MEEKIPFKRAEIALLRFNEQAIPYHMSLLKNHRSNIQKSLALGDWNKIKKEEINAMRVIKQVKNLLLEMDILREKVRPEDLVRFDATLDVGKNKAFESMKEYMELQLKSPTSTMSSRLTDDDEIGFSPDMPSHPVEIGTTMAYQQTVPQIETTFQQQEFQLSQREACLEELQSLQHEIRGLNKMFHNMNEMVQEQGESVQIIADNAEEALENVQSGESDLRRALYYKKAMYPVMGALLGTCIGGPIGLVAGLKAGGLAAVGCGILGYTGGSVLKSNPSVMQGNIEEEESEQQPSEGIELDKKNE